MRAGIGASNQFLPPTGGGPPRGGFHEKPGSQGRSISIRNFPELDVAEGLCETLVAAGFGRENPLAPGLRRGRRNFVPIDSRTRGPALDGPPPNAARPGPSSPRFQAAEDISSEPASRF